MNSKILGIFVMTLLITIATLPIVSAVPILDQRQEKCDGEKFIPNLAWQEFIPTMKLLREVEVKVTHWYGGSPNLKLSIEQPLGTVLTFKELPVSDIPSGTSGWVNFDVPDYTLTPGQKYYITLTYPPGGEYGWCAGNGDPYVSGESSGPADEDFCFRTWANKGKSKNSINIEGDWSDPLAITMPKNKQYIPFGIILAFGFDVDVKIVQLEPGEDYVDLEVLSKPFYIWENEIQTRNPGEFIRLYNAKGLFLPSLPFCFGICDDWGIIG